MMHAFQQPSKLGIHFCSLLYIGVKNGRGELGQGYKIPSILVCIANDLYYDPVAK